MNNYKLILLIWNIVVMVVYGIDKSFAKNKNPKGKFYIGYIDK